MRGAGEEEALARRFVPCAGSQLPARKPVESKSIFRQGRQISGDRAPLIAGIYHWGRVRPASYHRHIIYRNNGAHLRGHRLQPVILRICEQYPADLPIYSCNEEHVCSSSKNFRVGTVIASLGIFSHCVDTERSQSEFGKCKFGELIVSYE